MTTVCSKPGLLLVLALVLSASVQPPALAAEKVECIGDWSVSAELIKERALVPVEAITKRAKSKLAGKIVKTTLCNTKAGYAYMVVVRTAKGRLKTVKIDARHPFANQTKAK